MARSITSEEEYRKIRGSYEQKANLRLAREGNDGAKRRLVQFNYSGHYPQGVVKGTKLPSRAFGFDLDDKQDFEKAAKLMLQEPEKYGLLMLERSARQGGHAVCKREMGKTILENQVRIAKMMECEMDTSAHDINRVYFTTSADAGTQRKAGRSCGLQARDGQDYPGEPGKNCQDDGVRDGYVGSRY